MKYRFTVEGPLLGYRASIRRAFDPKYVQFKKKVAVLALEAGFDARKIDPMKQEVKLSVWAFWKNTPRIDWKNLYGAIEDSVFFQDRWVRPGSLNGFSTRNGRPAECAEVMIEVE